MKVWITAWVLEPGVNKIVEADVEIDTTYYNGVESIVVEHNGRKRRLTRPDWHTTKKEAIDRAIEMIKEKQDQYQERIDDWERLKKKIQRS